MRGKKKERKGEMTLDEWLILLMISTILFVQNLSPHTSWRSHVGRSHDYLDPGPFQSTLFSTTTTTLLTRSIIHIYYQRLYLDYRSINKSYKSNESRCLQCCLALAKSRMTMHVERHVHGKRTHTTYGCSRNFLTHTK